MHGGTEASRAILFVKDFILSHQGYTGTEAIVFIADLLDSHDNPDFRIPEAIKEVMAEEIPVYVVAILVDPALQGADYAETKLKLQLFTGTGIVPYDVAQIADFQPSGAGLRGVPHLAFSRLNAIRAVRSHSLLAR